MPNHITTVINASSNVINALLDKNNEVDFNNIFERPKIYEHFNGLIPCLYEGTIINAVELLAKSDPTLYNDIKQSKFDIEAFNSLKGKLVSFLMKHRENIKTPQEEAIKQDKISDYALQIMCLISTGKQDPLDWNRAYWGTKWNAYNTILSDDHSQVEFQTAWSHPVPIIEELSKRFPNETIDIKFADEDIGCNCGKYSILNGVYDIDESITGECTDEDIHFACELLGYDMSDYIG